MVTKTASRVLDDLALLGIAERTKKSAADNSPDMWAARDWLREHWPKKVGQRSTTRREGEVKEEHRNGVEHTDTLCTALGTSPSHFRPPTGLNRCEECGFHVPTQGHRDHCEAGVA